MKKITISILVLVLIVVLVLVFDFGRKSNNNIEIPKTEKTNDYTNMIEANTPQKNQEVKSPIEISGRARGNWYFEASFPVRLEDLNGNLIAEHHAEALSDWMTTDFVDFKAELEYDNTKFTGPAILILKNDNPSGDPKFDKEIRIPIILK